jgi:tRNA(fMet)-specific endonuclease VapC
MQYLLDTNTCVFFLRGKLNLDHIVKEKVRLRKIGKPINDEFDLLIGVTAVENKLTLVTDNSKDFDRINGIKMENWFTRK